VHPPHVCMRFFLKMNFRIPFPTNPCISTLRCCMLLASTDKSHLGHGILHVIISIRIDGSPVPVYLIGQIGMGRLGDLELIDYIKIIFVKVINVWNWNWNWNWIRICNRCKFNACRRLVPQFQGIAIHSAQPVSLIMINFYRGF